MNFCRIFFLFLSTSLFCASNILASQNKFITHINYLSASSFLSQISYQHIPKQHATTWLIDYDTLFITSIENFVKNLNQQDEVGIYLTITNKLIQDSEIYPTNDSSSKSNSLLLTSYSQADRKKLLDKSFSEFKKRFGHYPSSVGSPWTDSYSLSYLSSQYQVTANLNSSDFLGLYNDKIQGQYMQAPFYPSRLHSGIPAQTLETKLNLLNFQWKNNYLVSDQIQYIDKLSTNSSPNKFEHFTLVTDPSSIRSKADQQKLFNFISQNMSQKNFTASTMKSFTDWYMKSFPNLSPSQAIHTPGVTWHQSPYYRIGVSSDTIVDLRIYSHKSQEPYRTLINGKNYISINIPSIIDSTSNISESWALPKDSQIVFLEDSFAISPLPRFIPKQISSHPYLRLIKKANTLKVIFAPDQISASNGLLKLAGRPESVQTLNDPKLLINALLTGQWDHFRTTLYLISQDEVEALVKLSALPPGKVLVPNYSCINCNYSSRVMPLVYTNQRRYVFDIGKKIMITSSDILSSDPVKASGAIHSSNVKYIYLTQVESQIEQLKVLPARLGIKKIFENANAQIWEVNI